MKNGSPEATAEIEYSDTDSGHKNETGLSIDCAPGDIFSVRCTPDNTPNTRYARYAVVIEPDNLGESILLGLNNTTSNSVTTYTQLLGNTTGYTVTESDWYQKVGPLGFDIKGLYIDLDTAPGSGNTRTFTIRKNGSNTNNEVAISGTDTTGSDSSVVSYTDGDDIAFQMVPADTPADTDNYRWGAIQYIEVPEINVNDSISITESTGAFPDRLINVSDSISITETEAGDVPFLINVNEEISIEEYPRLLPNELKVWINEIDRTQYVSQTGFQIENILTHLVDKCKFQIRKVDGSDILDYSPTIGQDIQITFQYEKIFGGVITRINKYLDTSGILVFDCECEDYTKFLDRKLVAKTYENQSVNDIISDINDTYLTGFTINNVDCSTVIDFIAFNYITVSKSLAKLADLVHYDWYVDYDKDIHFFSKTDNSAPFDLLDTDGSYNINTLKIKQDNSQVRNSIYVRGGEYLASTFTTEIESDGVRDIYDIAYRYEDLTCTLSGQSLSVGADYIDSADDYDVLWNYQEKLLKWKEADKLLKWKEADKPSVSATIRVGGRPYLPVRLKTKNTVSINDMAALEGGDGEYEFIIIDDSIKTKQGALERANAELDNYKNTLVEGQFQTYQNGLRSGQKIRINSSLYDINEDYLINQVTMRMFTPTKLVYDVKIVSTKTYGLIEYLQDLLLRDNDKILDIGENVVTVDVVADPSYETMAIADTMTVAFNHPQYETSAIGETFTAQSLDYEVEFVTGPYTPSGKKRVFVISGSRLG